MSKTLTSRFFTSAIIVVAAIALVVGFLQPVPSQARESLTALRNDITQNQEDIADLWDAVTELQTAAAPRGAVFRWQVFSTYGNTGYSGWAMGNRPELFGGVYPSNWTDGNHRAVHMSSNPEVLRTLLINRGTAGSNAMIYSRTFLQYSSTEGRVVVSLFRVRNNTGEDIIWRPYFYYTSSMSWSEMAGVAVNGAEVWNSGGTNSGTSHNTNVSINIPANGTSTVIFSSPSNYARYTGAGGIHIRYVGLSFYNNSLDLPEGLEFVDDLDEQDAPLW